jgi:hypothetical protein
MDTSETIPLVNTAGQVLGAPYIRFRIISEPMAQPGPPWLTIALWAAACLAVAMLTVWLSRIDDATHLDPHDGYWVIG